VADPRLRADPRPTFFFDVGDPWSWLAGEQLGGRVVWQPVSAGALGIAFDLDRAAVEAAAAALDLPAVRWPARWPPATTLAMRAATFAKQTGRVVAFSLAAMRQQFLAGRDMSVEDNVLIAAAACELHPRAVLTGVRTNAVEAALTATTERARLAGVRELPAFLAGERLLGGPDAISEMVAATG
jgi:2-hydroxychromene-2-carboxylate isomerase